jgi:hypothetical protein
MHQTEAAIHEEIKINKNKDILYMKYEISSYFTTEFFKTNFKFYLGHC